MNNILEVSRTKLKYSNQRTTGAFGHIHNDYEVYYLISGEVQYFIQSSAFVLKAGDLVFIPKNIIHKTVYSINRTYERLLLNFTENMANQDAGQLLSELAPLHISIPSEYRQRIQEALLKLEEESNNSAPGRESIMTAYLTELIIHIYRYQSAFKSHRLSANSSTSIINRCAKYISENYQNEITLSEISRLAAMSESYFSREFKKNTGFGFNEYLVMNRLLASQKLLCSTTLPITSVATKCGFNDSNYFASVFKKQYGITPYKYRKLNSQ